MKNILLLSLFLISLNGFSQGYNITVNIKGNYSAPVYLGYHYGSSTFIVDTANKNSGNYSFVKNKKLGEGVYFLYLENKTFFDFLLDKNQQFSIEINLDSKENQISFTNSSQNTNFLNFQTEINKLHQKSAYYVDRLRTNSNNKDSVTKIQNEIYTFNKKIREYRLNTIENNKGTLLSAIISSMIEPDINEFNSRPHNTNTTLQAQHRYAFYKNHYFDYYNFTDTRLLRSELLENKIKVFFTSVVQQHPDSIIVESNKLLKKAEINHYAFKFVFDWLIKKYENLDKIGNDNIFVNLVDNYILANKTPWYTAQKINGYKQISNLLKPTLISKITPELYLPNKDGKNISLSKSYADATILVFYQMDDKKSNNVINEIVKSIQKFKDKDIMVYAVCINSNFDIWKDTPQIDRKNWINVSDIDNKVSKSGYYLEQVPRIFVLNYEKKISSNRIGTRDLNRILARIL